jgi:hypothetical protein
MPPASTCHQSHVFPLGIFIHANQPRGRDGPAANPSTLTHSIAMLHSPSTPYHRKHILFGPQHRSQLDGQVQGWSLFPFSRPRCTGQRCTTIMINGKHISNFTFTSHTTTQHTSTHTSGLILPHCIHSYREPDNDHFNRFEQQRLPASYRRGGLGGFR